MISVIIPTYNRAHLITETLDSVLAQSYTDWECIIVDDHSDDHTDEIVENYVKKDSRFRYFKKPKHLPKGPSASRNFGMTKAKGDYINWLDSDDLMHPEKMEVDLRLINSGDYDFTISQSKFFTDDESPPKKEFWNKNLWSDDPINDFIMMKMGWSVNSSLWKKKSLLERNIKFREDILTADDYAFHISVLFNQLNPVFIHEVLIFLREHNLRLNGHNFKSPSKIIVFNQIMKVDYKYLSHKTKNFLNTQIYKQLTNLLKKKKFRLYLKFLVSSLLLNYNIITKLKSISKLPYGLFYLLTNKGYKFLN